MLAGTFRLKALFTPCLLSVCVFVRTEKVQPRQPGSMQSCSGMQAGKPKPVAVNTVPGNRMKIKKEKEEEAPQNCAYCGQEFKTKKSYLFHVEKSLCKKKEHPYKCNDCDQSFTREASLKNHIKSQHENPDPGVDGDKNDNEGRIEEKTNTDGPSPREYQCRVCGKVLHSSWTLKKHIARFHSLVTAGVKTER